MRCEEVVLTPIEQIDWLCLGIASLGKGQIQVKKAENLLVGANQSRQEWMVAFCERLLEFYPREKKKLDKRILEAARIKASWLSRQR